MPQDLTDDKSALIQVMAWCRQATSHYLNQCWPRSSTPYGVTRHQWVKLPSSVISDNFACCRLTANLSEIIVQKEERYESVAWVQGKPCPHVSLLKIWKRSVAAKWRKQAKSFRSERPRRRHLDDVATPGCSQCRPSRAPAPYREIQPKTADRCTFSSMRASHP